MSENRKGEDQLRDDHYLHFELSNSNKNQKLCDKSSWRELGIDVGKMKYETELSKNKYKY